MLITASGLWLVFTYVVSDARLALEHLRAFLWPAVVVTVLYWFRAPLQDKLRELLKPSPCSHPDHISHMS